MKTHGSILIKLGLYLCSAFGQDVMLSYMIDDLVIQVRKAKDYGFASIWAGQHFLHSDRQMLQPIPLLARLVPEVEGLLVGSNALILPLLNPVAVAEIALTMDHLTSGRFVLGVAQGHRDVENQAFRIPEKERAGRFAEAISLIRRLWVEPKVNHSGRYFIINNSGIGLQPYQSGGPPIWIAATMPSAIKRAGRLGDAWLISTVPSIADLRKNMLTYSSARVKAGKAIPIDVPILRECYVSTNHRAALAECQEPLRDKYDAYFSMRLENSQRIEPAWQSQSFESFVKERFVIGDPVFVRDEIQRYHASLGINHFILRVQWPGLEQEKVLRTIDLLGSKVIPFLN